MSVSVGRPAAPQTGAGGVGGRKAVASSFRADIEGLRGICVLAVVVYHAFPNVLPGGFVGVDIFFVISGYLITRLLLSEFDRTGRIDLLEFWARRIRRILPVATVVILMTALMAVVMPIVDPKQLSRWVVGASLFHLNVQQVIDSVDYLRGDHARHLLLHYWSLGVEEQFYLLWPLMLVVALRVGLVGCVVALWLASFTWCVAMTGAGHPIGFFDVSARAWQLLTGTLVVIVERRQTAWSSTTCNVISVSAMTGIIASMVQLSSAQPYPGMTALLPTASAAVLIAANQGPSALSNTRVATPVLRAIGLVSFAWYLTHWPILIFARTMFGASAPTLITAVIVSLVAAVALHRLVEVPFRHHPRLVASRAATYAFAAAMVTAGVLTGVALRHLAPDRMPLSDGTVIDLGAASRDRAVIYDDRCLVRFEATTSPPCIYGDTSAGRTVVLFGDSTAANWFPAIDKAARDTGWRLVVRVKASCRPIDAPQSVDAPRTRPYGECTVWQTFALNEMRDSPPDLILVAGTAHDLSADAERAMLATLGTRAPTIALRSPPKLPLSPPACLRQTRSAAACAWPVDATQAATMYPRSAVRGLPANVSVRDFNDLVCPAGRCASIEGGVVTRFDPLHFTARYAEHFVPAFRDILSNPSRPGP